MKLLPLLCLILLSPFTLYGFQECKLKIRLDPVKASIRAGKITSKAGDDIADDSIMANGLILSGDTLSLDTVNTPGTKLNLFPGKSKRRVWRCDFQNSVNIDNIAVKYTLVAANGRSGGISNGNAFIPITVRTRKLIYKNNRKTVFGDMKFIFDLSYVQAKASGQYGGVLTIEVYEK